MRTPDAAFGRAPRRDEGIGKILQRPGEIPKGSARYRKGVGEIARPILVVRVPRTRPPAALPKGIEKILQRPGEVPEGSATQRKESVR